MTDHDQLLDAFDAARALRVYIAGPALPKNPDLPKNSGGCPKTLTSHAGPAPHRRSR